MMRPNLISVITVSRIVRALLASLYILAVFFAIGVYILVSAKGWGIMLMSMIGTWLVLLLLISGLAYIIRLDLHKPIYLGLLFLTDLAFITAQIFVRDCDDYSCGYTITKFLVVGSGNPLYDYSALIWLMLLGAASLCSLIMLVHSRKQSGTKNAS